MYQPIQRDHELCCPSCGCVLANIEETPIQKPPSISMSVNNLLLGSALNKNVRTRRERDEERVLRQLVSIVNFYKLPESIAIDTFNVLKKRNKGFYSETEPIKQLIKQLDKDDYYFFIKTKNLIKSRYENSLNC